MFNTKLRVRDLVVVYASLMNPDDVTVDGIIIAFYNNKVRINLETAQRIAALYNPETGYKDLAPYYWVDKNPDIDESYYKTFRQFIDFNLPLLFQ